MRSNPFDAVLLFAFGGPQGPHDVDPFLDNVLRGRRVSQARIDEVAQHYQVFGGVSPLTELTFRQAAGLQDRIREQGPALPVYVGMRNWRPFLVDTLREMAAAGHRRAIGFIMAPHRSYSSCGQYRQNVLDARLELAATGCPAVEVTYVNDWHLHDGFVAANARHVQDALSRLPANVRSSATLVFTAHSIPVEMAARSPYKEQLRASAREIARRVGIQDWALVFQSRSGRPQDPWLGPDILDYLRDHRDKNLRAIVMCPVGFVCDHIEVLYDLDHEAGALCHELDLSMARAAAVNDNPIFLDMMADVVRTTFDTYAAGRALPLVSESSPERPKNPPLVRPVSAGVDSRP